MENIKEIFYGSQSSNKHNEIREIKINWTEHSKGIINIAKIIEPNFKVTDQNKEVLRKLLLYFSGNPTFEDYGSLNKGIMLVGGVGSGKSLLFKIFKQYSANILRVNSFQYYDAIEIIDTVNVSGIEHLDKFSHNFKRGTQKANPLRIYIDDIASKNEKVKHFGTEYSVIEQLMSLRYNIFKRYGTLTHATSNKFPAELIDVYDARIVDRMNDMFNFFELEGESFRK